MAQPLAILGTALLALGVGQPMVAHLCLLAARARRVRAVATPQHARQGVPPSGEPGPHPAVAYAPPVHWQWLVGAALAFLLALATTPAGVSGAVLLLPIQLSVLHVPSPSVTPTNLLFNVAATPGGLLRFAGEHRLRGPLTGLLIAGTLPGVIAGAILRVEVFSGQRSFEIIAALVLLPLGLWLLLGAQNLTRSRPEPTRRHQQATWLLALVVGTIGGLYGIGGGSILAPILIALGYSVYEVAPATLTATFLTSIAGIATYQILQAVHGGAIAPQWILGAFLGAGGFAGSYCGARLQSRLPERSLRRLLGLIACLVAARYLQTAATTTSQRPQPPGTRTPPDRRHGRSHPNAC